MILILRMLCVAVFVKSLFHENEIRCRDHCHRIGKNRGATHQKRNINYFCNRYTPVNFHNLRDHDSHFIIKQAHEILRAILRLTQSLTVMRSS